MCEGPKRAHLGSTAVTPAPTSALLLLTLCHRVSMKTSYKFINSHKDVFLQMELWGYISRHPSQNWSFCNHVNYNCQNSIVFILYFCGESAPRRNFSLASRVAPLKKDIFLSRMILMINLTHSKQCLGTVHRWRCMCTYVAKEVSRGLWCYSCICLYSLCTSGNSSFCLRKVSLLPNIFQNVCALFSLSYLPLLFLFPLALLLRHLVNLFSDPSDFFSVSP